MRDSVFCLKISLGVAGASLAGAAVASVGCGGGALAVGMDLVMAKKS